MIQEKVVKERMAKRRHQNQLDLPALLQEYLQAETLYLDQTLVQETWEQADLPCSVQHVENAITGADLGCTITTALHARITACNTHVQDSKTQQSCNWYLLQQYRSQCPNKPWDNREQPRPTPDDLRNQQNQQSNIKNAATTTENQSSTVLGTANHKNLGPASLNSSTQGSNTGSNRNNSSNSHSRQQQSNQSSRGSHGNAANTKNWKMHLP